MKMIARNIVVFALLVLVMGGASHAYAQSAPTGGLVTCGQNGPLNANGTQACGFPQLIQMISNIIDFLVFVIAPIIMVCVVLYAGVLLIFSAGSAENVTKARSMFFKAVIGLVIAMIAWIGVKSILVSLNIDTTVFPTFY